MEFFDKLGKKASEAYKVTADKTGNLAKEAKLSMKISELKSQINDIYKEIGECVYQKHTRDGEYDISKEIEEKCTKIDVLSDEIDSNLKQCLELKDKRQCPNCFAEIEKDVKFCPKCGSPIKNSAQIYTTTTIGEDTITFKVNGVSFSMIKVEAGSFDMGDDENTDAPSHEVNITHDYYIGETVVTNELALAILTDKNGVDEFGCLDEDDIDEMKDNPNLPLVNVSWYTAKSLIRILKKITG